jgi:hypothetical protein
MTKSTFKNLGDVQHNMLKRFGPVSRELRFFTTPTRDGQLGISLATRHMAELVNAGMVRQVDERHYRISDAGRAWLDDKAKASMPGRFCNSSAPGLYTGSELKYRGAGA